MYRLVLEYGEIEEAKSSDVPFHLCLQFEATFDFNFPFRPLLEYICDCVRKKIRSAELILPEYLEFEDFVEGEMKLPDRSIGIYFEHSLAYLSFSSEHQEDLEFLVSSSGGLALQHPGYGLDDADLGAGYR